MSKFVFVSTPSVLVKDDILGSWPVFSKEVVAHSKGGFGRVCPCVSASVRINHALASSFHSPPHVFVALAPRAFLPRRAPHVFVALAPRLAGLAEAAAAADLDALGAATFRLDLGSFRHETQYSRIFRS